MTTRQASTPAGPDADRVAVIRARVALAVTRDTTLALGGGTLDAADRAEILDAAVRALSPSAASAPSTVKAADPVDTASD